MFTHNCLVSSDVSKWTRGSPLTRGSDIELTHGCSTLVHAREGERLGAKLLGQGDLNVKGDVLHGSHQQLHPSIFTLKLWMKWK